MSTKWAILRNALVTKEAEADTSAVTKASIHRHDGFHMFTKTKGAAPSKIVEVCNPSVEGDGLATAVARDRDNILAAFSDQGVDTVTIVAATAGAAAVVSAVAAEWGVEVLTETSPAAAPDSVGASCRAVVARRDGLDVPTFTTQGGLRQAGFEVVRYQVPRMSDDNDVHDDTTATSSTGTPMKDDFIVVRVLERRANAKLSFAELAPRSNDVGDASCFNNRVDNTGNVRVWPAEEVLLHLLLRAARQHKATCMPNQPSAACAPLIDASTSSSTMPPSLLTRETYPTVLPASFFASGGKRVLELGGGMTALAAFGFAAATGHVSFAPGHLSSPPQATSSIDNSPSAVPLVAHMTVTDGNTSSVEAQRAAAALNAPLLNRCDVAVQRLFWEEADASGTEATLRRVLRNLSPSPDATTTTNSSNCANVTDKSEKVRVGSAVEAQWQTGRKWHHGAVVKAVHVDESMAVAYADGDYWAHVPPYKVRWPGTIKPLAPPPYAPNFAVAADPLSNMAKDDDHGDSGGESSSDELEEAFRYDLIIGADLLFFESHAALAKTLDRLLKQDPTAPAFVGANNDNNNNTSGSSSSGSSNSESICAATALLVQPSRNGTMERFCAHPEVTTRFRVEVFNGPLLCPQLAEAHARYQSDPAYSPTLHCPQLIRLTRLPKALANGE